MWIFGNSFTHTQKPTSASKCYEFHAVKFVISKKLLYFL